MAQDREIEFILRVRDEASRQAARVSQTMRQMQGNYKAKLTVASDFSSFLAQAKKADATVAALQKRAGKGIVPDFSGVDKALKSAISHTTNLIRLFRTLQIIIAAAFGVALVGGIAAAALAIKPLVTNVVKLNAEMEIYVNQLRTSLGSLAAAKKEIAGITIFAKETPFQIKEVVAAVVKLRAYSMDASKWLRPLGDMAAAFGKDITNAVEATADAIRGDFKRLREYGVVFKKIDFKKYGKYAGESYADAVFAAIESRFKGGMLLQSRTLRGIWSNILDTLSISAMEAGEPMFKIIKGYATKLYSALDDLRQSGKLNKYVTTITRFFKSVVEVGERTLSFFKNQFAKDFSSAIKDFGQFVKNIGELIYWLTNDIVKNTLVTFNKLAAVIASLASGSKVHAVLFALGVVLLNVAAGALKTQIATTGATTAISRLGTAASGAAAKLTSFASWMGAILLITTISGYSLEFTNNINSIKDALTEMGVVTKSSTKEIVSLLERVGNEFGYTKKVMSDAAAEAVNYGQGWEKVLEVSARVAKSTGDDVVDLTRKMADFAKTANIPTDELSKFGNILINLKNAGVDLASTFYVWDQYTEALANSSNGLNDMAGIALAANLAAEKLTDTREKLAKSRGLDFDRESVKAEEYLRILSGIYSMYESFLSPSEEMLINLPSSAWVERSMENAQDMTKLLEEYGQNQLQAEETINKAKVLQDILNELNQDLPSEDRWASSFMSNLDGVQEAMRYLERRIEEENIALTELDMALGEAEDALASFTAEEKAAERAVAALKSALDSARDSLQKYDDAVPTGTNALTLEIMDLGNEINNLEIQRLREEVKSVEFGGFSSAVDRAEQSLNRAERALSAVSRSLDAQDASLDPLRDQLEATSEQYDKLTDAVNEAQDAIKEFTRPRLQGMGEWEDKIFNKEQEITNLKLRLAEENKKLLPYERFMGGTEAFKFMSAKRDAIQQQIDIASNELDRMEMEYDSIYEPQFRALEKLADQREEVAFDYAKNMILEKQAVISTLQPQIDLLKEQKDGIEKTLKGKEREIELQRRAVEARGRELDAQRDALEMQKEQESLAQNALDNNIKLLNLKKQLAEAEKSALEYQLERRKVEFDLPEEMSIDNIMSGYMEYSDLVKNLEEGVKKYEDTYARARIKREDQQEVVEVLTGQRAEVEDVIDELKSKMKALVQSVPALIKDMDWGYVLAEMPLSTIKENLTTFYPIIAELRALLKDDKDAILDLAESAGLLNDETEKNLSLWEKISETISSAERNILNLAVAHPLIAIASLLGFLWGGKKGIGAYKKYSLEKTISSGGMLDIIKGIAGKNVQGDINITRQGKSLLKPLEKSLSAMPALTATGDIVQDLVRGIHTLEEMPRLLGSDILGGGSIEDFRIIAKSLSSLSNSPFIKLFKFDTMSKLPMFNMSNTARDFWGIPTEEAIKSYRTFEKALAEVGMVIAKIGDEIFVVSKDLELSSSVTFAKNLLGDVNSRTIPGKPGTSGYSLRQVLSLPDLAYTSPESHPNVYKNRFKMAFEGVDEIFLDIIKQRENILGIGGDEYIRRLFKMISDENTKSYNTVIKTLRKTSIFTADKALKEEGYTPSSQVVRLLRKFNPKSLQETVDVFKTALFDRLIGPGYQIIEEGPKVAKALEDANEIRLAVNRIASRLKKISVKKTKTGEKWLLTDDLLSSIRKEIEKISGLEGFDDFLRELPDFLDSMNFLFEQNGRASVSLKAVKTKTLAVKTGKRAATANLWETLFGEKLPTIDELVNTYMKKTLEFRAGRGAKNKADKLIELLEKDSDAIISTREVVEKYTDKFYDDFVKSEIKSMISSKNRHKLLNDVLGIDASNLKLRPSEITPLGKLKYIGVEGGRYTGLAEGITKWAEKTGAGKYGSSGVMEFIEGLDKNFFDTYGDSIWREIEKATGKNMRELFDDIYGRIPWFKKNFDERVKNYLETFHKEIRKASSPKDIEKVIRRISEEMGMTIKGTEELVSELLEMSKVSIEGSVDLSKIFFEGKGAAKKLRSLKKYTYSELVDFYQTAQLSSTEFFDNVLANITAVDGFANDVFTLTDDLAAQIVESPIITGLGQTGKTYERLPGLLFSQEEISKALGVELDFVKKIISVLEIKQWDEFIPLMEQLSNLRGTSLEELGEEQFKSIFHSLARTKRTGFNFTFATTDLLDALKYMFERDADEAQKILEDIIGKGTPTDSGLLKYMRQTFLSQARSKKTDNIMKSIVTGFTEKIMEAFDQQLLSVDPAKDLGKSAVSATFNKVVKEFDTYIKKLAAGESLAIDRAGGRYIESVPKEFDKILKTILSIVDEERAKKVISSITDTRLQLKAIKDAADELVDDVAGKAGPKEISEEAWDKIAEKLAKNLSSFMEEYEKFARETFPELSSDFNFEDLLKSGTEFQKEMANTIAGSETFKKRYREAAEEFAKEQMKKIARLADEGNFAAIDEILKSLDFLLGSNTISKMQIELSRGVNLGEILPLQNLGGVAEDLLKLQDRLGPKGDIYQFLLSLQKIIEAGGGLSVVSSIAELGEVIKFEGENLFKVSAEVADKISSALKRTVPYTVEELEQWGRRTIAMAGASGQAVPEIGGYTPRIIGDNQLVFENTKAVKELTDAIEKIASENVKKPFMESLRERLPKSLQESLEKWSIKNYYERQNVQKQALASAEDLYKSSYLEGRMDFIADELSKIQAETGLKKSELYEKNPVYKALANVGKTMEKEWGQIQVRRAVLDNPELIRGLGLEGFAEIMGKTVDITDKASVKAFQKEVKAGGLSRALGAAMAIPAYGGTVSRFASSMKTGSIPGMAYFIGRAGKDVNAFKGGVDTTLVDRPLRVVVGSAESKFNNWGFGTLGLRSGGRKRMHGGPPFDFQSLMELIGTTSREQQLATMLGGVGEQGWMRQLAGMGEIKGTGLLGLGERFLPKLGKGFGALGTGITKYRGFSQKMMKAGVPGLSKLIGKRAAAMLGMGPVGWGAMIYDIGNALTGDWMNEKVWKKLFGGKTIQKFARDNKFTKLLESGIGTKALENLIDYLREFWELLHDFSKLFEDTFNVIIGFFKGVFTGDWQKFKDGLSSFYDTLVDIPRRLAAMVREALEIVFSLLDRLGEKIFGENWKEIKNTLLWPFIKFWEWITGPNGIGEWYNVLVGGLKGIFGWIGDHWSLISDLITAPFKAVWAFLTMPGIGPLFWAEAIIVMLSRFITFIKDPSWANLWRVVVYPFELAWSWLQNNVMGWGSKIYEWMANTVDSVKKAWDNFKAEHTVLGTFIEWIVKGALFPIWISFKLAGTIPEAIQWFFSGAKGTYNSQWGMQMNSALVPGAGYAEGGISRGPASGYYELLHGTEAVIPLKNGSIPIKLTNIPKFGANFEPTRIQLEVIESGSYSGAGHFSGMTGPPVVNAVGMSGSIVKSLDDVPDIINAPFEEGVEAAEATLDTLPPTLEDTINTGMESIFGPDSYYASSMPGWITGPIENGIEESKNNLTEYGQYVSDFIDNLISQDKMEKLQQDLETFVNYGTGYSNYSGIGMVPQFDPSTIKFVDEFGNEIIKVSQHADDINDTFREQIDIRTRGIEKEREIARQAGTLREQLRLSNSEYSTSNTLVSDLNYSYTTGLNPTMLATVKKAEENNDELEKSKINIDNAQTTTDGWLQKSNEVGVSVGSINTTTGEIGTTVGTLYDNWFNIGEVLKNDVKPQIDLLKEAIETIDKIVSHGIDPTGGFGVPGGDIGSLENFLKSSIPAALVWGGKPTGYGGMTPKAETAWKKLKAVYPNANFWGGFDREYHTPKSDHWTGNAFDVGVGGNALKDTKASMFGDSVASWLLNNERALGVKYVIWKQRIAHHPGGWKDMEDRKSITANHFDHVHVSFDKYHGGGLVTGEVPAILQVGERVLSQEQTAWFDSFQAYAASLERLYQEPLPVELVTGNIDNSSRTINVHDGAFTFVVRDNEDIEEIKEFIVDIMYNEDPNRESMSNFTERW